MNTDHKLSTNPDANCLLSKKKTGASRFIASIKIKPREQAKIALGEFTSNNTPSGFTVDLAPNPNPDNSVDSRVTTLGTTKHYKLTMHIANYGTKTMAATIWQI